MVVISYPHSSMVLVTNVKIIKVSLLTTRYDITIAVPKPRFKVVILSYKVFKSYVGQVTYEVIYEFMRMS